MSVGGAYDWVLTGVAWSDEYVCESWRDLFRLVLRLTCEVESEGVVRWSELDAEDVFGGWKKCDFAPALMSSLGGRMVSKEKEPGMILMTLREEGGLDDAMMEMEGEMEGEGESLECKELYLQISIIISIMNDRMIDIK